MTDYVEVLKQQVEEEKKTRPTTPLTSNAESSSLVSKKILLPLEEPEEIDSSAENVQKQYVEVESEAKFVPKEPANKKTNPRTSNFKTETSTQATGENEKPKQQGGALWGPPPNEAELRKSYAEAIHQMREKEGPSLMEFAMREPPKPLEPTLQTYYDRLMLMK